MASIIAACLNPPAITPSEGLPPWILLDARVYLAHHDDATTATAKTSRGHTIHVSIRLADPPALSHVCLHCPGLRHDNFAEEPRVVRSEKQFLLLHLPLNWSTGWVRRSSEYYVYQAAVPGKPPALSRIPEPPGDTMLVTRDIGIHCCNGDDGEYVLAGLYPTGGLTEYGLCLYSSVSKAWTRKPACLERPPVDKYRPTLAHKVIPLGGSLLGWVDLWKGMLVCDVLADDVPSLGDPLDDDDDDEERWVRVWFVPLPGLLPGNQGDEHVCPWMVRDVTCTNGLLKCIEVELLTTVVQNVVRESMTTTSDDSCFVKPDDNAPRRKLVGWRFVVWNRMLSDNGWRRVDEVHARDVLVVNPSHSALLAELGDSNVAMMNLVPSFPTLSIHGDDVVQMNCWLRSDIDKAQMISVDMGNKTLKTLGPSLPGEMDNCCPHFPCVLSNHLSKAPALAQVVHNSENVNAASRQTVEASNSGNQGLSNCAQQLVGAPNQTQNALPQAIQASNSENVNEHQHLWSCDQEVISVPNPSQNNGGSNVDLSLPPQQSFGLLDAGTSYNGSPYGYGYADHTHPSYDIYQRSLAFQHQPDYTCPSYDNYQRPLALQQQPDYTRPSYDNYQRPLALQQQPDYTRPSYDNYQRSLALHQQPAYPPNMLHTPGWFSSRPVNNHPAYPVFNTVAFGQMVHPPPLNNCHMFQPPSQVPVGSPTPFRTPLPTISHAVAGRSILGSRPLRPHRYSPYERSAE